MGFTVLNVEIDNGGGGNNSVWNDPSGPAADISQEEWVDRMLIGLLAGEFAEQALQAGHPASKAAVTGYAEIVVRLTYVAPTLLATNIVAADKPPPNTDLGAIVYWMQLAREPEAEGSTYLKSRVRDAVSMLKDNWSSISAVADALLSRGKLDKSEIDSILAGGSMKPA